MLVTVLVEAVWMASFLGSLHVRYVLFPEEDHDMVVEPYVIGRA